MRINTIIVFLSFSFFLVAVFSFGVYYTISNQQRVLGADIEQEVQIPQVLATPVEARNTYRFALLNGTGEIGLTRKFENSLIQQIPQSKVVARAFTIDTNYKGTKIYDLLGNRFEDTTKIAQLLNISVATFPENEVAPIDADFAIIVGKASVDE